MTPNDYEDCGEHLASPPGSVQCQVWKKSNLHLRGLQGKPFPQEGTRFHKEHTTHYVIEELKSGLKYRDFFSSINHKF